MLKFVHLFKNYYLGISIIGVIAFVIQEIPYIIMPLVKPESNPIMNMQNEIKWVETVQGIFGMLSMILLMLLVRDDVNHTGHQYGWLIVISQFAVVPLYYLCFGLWRNNYPLAGTSAIFFIIHTINGCMNFIVKK